MRSCSMFFVLLLVSCVTAPVDLPRHGEAIPVTTISDEARDLYFSGREKAELMHAEEARADYRAALEMDPDFAIAWLALSEVSASREDADRALDRAVSLADRVSEAERLHIRATEASHNGDAEEARRLWTLLVEDHDPTSAEAHYRLGLSYWSTDDDRAVKYMERAVEIDPDYHSAWNMLGYLYAQFGSIDDAVRAHRRYVELVPEEPNSHDSYAETLLRAGRYEESIASYRRALAIDPDFTASKIGVGHNLVFLRRYADAIAAYEDALATAKAPNDSFLANIWLVVCGVYANRPDVSLSAAERGVRLGADLGDYEAASAVLRLARIHLWRGELTSARDTAGRALVRLGETATPVMKQDITHGVLRLLLEVDLAEGDVAAASARLKDLEAAGGNTWQRQLSAFAAGLIDLADEDPEAALEAFDKSFASDPRILYARGLANEKLRRTSEALENYRRIVTLNMPSLGHALVYSSARARLSVLRYR